VKWNSIDRRAVNGLPGNHYWIWAPGMPEPQKRRGELIQTSECGPQGKKIAMQVDTDG